MNYTFAVESLNAILEEIKPLFEKHWEEINRMKHLFVLNPDWDMYDKMEQSDLMVLITVRAEGALVGYAAYTKMHHPHYKNVMIAQNDVVFVLPEHRGQTGRRLIQAAEAALESMGIQCVTMHVKPYKNFGPMLERTGYKLHELVYLKELQ
jgi:GNAT superfamily N-acetyltransferase